MSIKGIVGSFIAGVIVLALLIGAFIFVERVPEGQVSVVYSPSGGASRVLDPGWNMIGLFEKTTKYPTRITIIDDSISVTTSDGKKISMNVKYQMKVDRKKVLNIFKELGSQNVEQIQEGYLFQNLFRTSREVISQYSVLDIYGQKASEASAKVTEAMAESVKDLGFIITDVTLGSPDLDEETQKAIDERVKASQELEKKSIELDIAEAEAERKKVEAEGEKEANKILSESLTDELLNKMAIEKWNGEMPKAITGEGSGLLLDLPSGKSESDKGEK